MKKTCTGRMVLIIYLLLIALFSYGQEAGFLNGQVLDVEDHSPVAFATVRIYNRAIGVITNADGSFRIPDHFRDLGDSLEISSLGYTSKTVKWSDWDTQNTKIFYLDQEVEMLDEVVVTAKQQRLNAREIILRALTNITKNYPMNPYSYIGYYRDYQMVDNDYVNLNEAIIQIYDQGFQLNDYQFTQAKILRLKKNKSFPRDTSTAVSYNYRSGTKIIPNAFMEAYGGNELLILRIHDAIRNYNTDAFSYVNSLQEDFLGNHEFKREGIINYKGDRIYRISIYKDESNIRVRGDIFISAKNFGIVKMDYQVYLLQSRPNPLKYTTVAKSKEKLLYQIIVEYSLRDRYYLNYLSFRNFFEVNPSPLFILETVTYNPNKAQFELEFKTKPNKKDAEKLGNYRLKYARKKIKLDSAYLRPDGKSVVLIPKKSLVGERLLAMMHQDITKEDFDIKLGKIRDENGDLMNDSKKKEVEQFREFFVQQEVVDPILPRSEEYMSKNQPLFVDQPLDPQDIGGEYWMNTPLKK